MNPDAGMKSKILRKVSFPFVLDMYDFCDEKLQGELSVVRALSVACRDVVVLRSSSNMEPPHVYQKAARCLKATPSSAFWLHDARAHKAFTPPSEVSLRRMTCTLAEVSSE